MAWTEIGPKIEEIAQHMCDKYSKYLVWCSEDYGKEFYLRYKNHINIIGFIAPGATGQNIDAFGLKVYHPSDIMQISNKYQIIVAAKRTKSLKEVDKYLYKIGLKKNEDFYHAIFFESVYGAYALDKAILNYVEISITEICSLKCKNCSLFMPYFKYPQHTDLDIILQDVDTLFQNIDYVFHFRILGGEPFLHPQIDSILAYIIEHYREKIDYFDVATNGTIMPKQSTLKHCKTGRVTISISDYRINAKYVQKVNDLIEQIEKNEISYHRNCFEYWYELGFPIEKEESISVESKKNLFEKCSTEWRSFYKNRLYFCSVCSCAQRADLIQGFDTDGFEFTNKIDKKKLLWFNLGFNEVGYNSLCGLCKGYMPAANRKYVKPGVQTAVEDPIATLGKVRDRGDYNNG